MKVAVANQWFDGSRLLGLTKLSYHFSLWSGEKSLPTQRNHCTKQSPNRRTSSHHTCLHTVVGRWRNIKTSGWMINLQAWQDSPMGMPLAQNLSGFRFSPVRPVLDSTIMNALQASRECISIRRTACLPQAGLNPQAIKAVGRSIIPSRGLWNLSITERRLAKSNVESSYHY